MPARDSSRRIAKKDGIVNILPVAKAVEVSDVIIFCFPDHLHGKVYKKQIAPNLNPRSALVFLHGFSIHFGTVAPPDDADVILLAPLAPGKAVREEYIKDRSVGYFYAVKGKAGRRAHAVLNRLVEHLRIDRAKLIRTTFAEEAIGDLFGEQAVLCGGLSQLIRAGFETLVESGLAPDKAYLEVAYQLDLIVGLIKDYGIEGMFKRVSVAARYGSYLNKSAIIDPATRKRMKKLLMNIQDGSFARQLNRLTPDRIKNLNRQLKNLTNPAFEKAVQKLSDTGRRKKSARSKRRKTF